MMTFKPLPLALASLALGVLAGVLLTNAANAGNAVTSKSDVEAIVRDYIAENGEELAMSIQRAGTRAQREQMKTIIDKDTPSVGSENAPVTIIEFSDYECPFCARVQGTVSELRGQYGNKVRWVYKNLPLNFHANAKPAAYAALAAHNQGKFWEFHKALWSQQANLNDATYVAIAKELGLDMDRFNKDRAGDAIKARVEADLKQAEEVGARGTPHFIINGEGVSGALPTAEFRRVIDTHLKAAK
jgi:protein-disulfide isomerase